MEDIIAYAINHLDIAHWILFGLLMLAGLNVPLSEDLLIIVGGGLASQVGLDHAVKLYLAVFLGAYLSDWEAYWLGRTFGLGLRRFSLFRYTLRPSRLRRLSYYFMRYGFRTLLVGRFIPFGVRNALFMTAGISRMSFPLFLMSDGLACICSTTFLFTMAYSFGKNYALLYLYVQSTHLLMALACVFSLALLSLMWYKNRPASHQNGGLAAK